MAMRVVVVGGGVTGLAAARRLRERGVAVTLIDRGFPFGGGRVPVRAAVPGYGRPAFDPRPVVLGPARYAPGHPDTPLGLPPLGLRAGDNVPGLAAAARYAPVVRLSAGGGTTGGLWTLDGGVRALVGLLLPKGYDDHLTLLDRTEVTALEPAAGWRVRVRECAPAGADPGPARTVAADAVLLTQALPGAIDLLDRAGLDWPDPVRDQLRAVRYARGMSLLAAFRGPSGLPPGGFAEFSDSPVSLVHDNHAAGASPVGPALTALVTPGWAAEHWDEPDDEVARRLLPLVAPWAGGEAVWHRVVRHDHVRPSGRPRMPFAEASDAPPAVLAGEAFAGSVRNPLDAAFTSAVHAADHLCRVLGRVARSSGRKSVRTPARATLEVAVASSAEAAAAVGGGADRLLLMAAPEVGGLTPTLDAFLGARRAARAAGRSVPVTVLVRPRVGDCGYDADELGQMARDIRRFLRAGADGVAFGAVRPAGGEPRVDADACRPLVALARGRGRRAVFHRAFDLLPDRRTGLQDLIALGFDRVLTAGRWGLAIDDAGELAADVAYAGWDIEVAAAGGVDARTAGYVVRATGCRHVLAGLRERVADPGPAGKQPGGPARRVFRPERVGAAAEALRRAASGDTDPRGDAPEPRRDPEPAAVAG